MFNFGDVDFFLDSLWINFAIKKNEFAKTMRIYSRYFIY
jgi:hypothetical protein